MGERQALLHHEKAACNDTPVTFVQQFKMFARDTKSLAESVAHKANDTFHVFAEYGDHSDAYDRITCILQMLSSANYHRARSQNLSVYERIIGGIAWILQQLIPREQAQVGRIQCDFLFQKHDSLKSRLVVAQEIILRLVSLSSLHTKNITEGSMTCPYPIQPHQLLLQDYGDISTVKNVIEWLLAALEDDRIKSAEKLKRSLDSHRFSSDETRYAVEKYRNRHTSKKEEVLPKIHNEMLGAIEQHFHPQRRWKYRTGEEFLEWKKNATEQARIQSCLLEYGERITFNREAHYKVIHPSQLESNEYDDDLLKMGELANNAKSDRQLQSKHKKSKAEDFFEKMYEQAESQALSDQMKRLELQKMQEVEILNQVTKIEKKDEYLPQKKHFDKRSLEVDLKEKLKSVQNRRIELEAQKNIYIEAMEQLGDEKARLIEVEKSAMERTSLVRDLKDLIIENDELKHRKSEFRAKCRREAQQREARMVRIRNQLSAAKCDDLKITYARMEDRLGDLSCRIGDKTRSIHILRQRIDQVPCQLEVLQYEKRYSELSDEVALHLEETRKYYATYNTLKKKLEFLVKETTLIGSVSVQVDEVAASKSAQISLLEQLDVVAHNIHETIQRHQTVLALRQAEIDTLEHRFQILQQKEHAYVAAIREFQKECEKHEELLAKLEEMRRHA